MSFSNIRNKNELITRCNWFEGAVNEPMVVLTQVVYLWLQDIYNSGYIFKQIQEDGAVTNMFDCNFIDKAASKILFF